MTSWDRPSAPTARVQLMTLAGSDRRMSLGHRLPAYAHELPDERADQRERLEANAALVLAWSAAAGVPADGTGWTRHEGGAPRPPTTEPRLSLSHTRRLAAVAICAGADVGVDVERSRGVHALEDVAAGALAPEELLGWRLLEPTEREGALMTAWTRKEAVLKALGTGLAGGLRSVVLDAAGTLCALSPSAGDPAEWTLVGLDAGPAAWGAVAIRHPGARVVALPWATSSSLLSTDTDA